MAGEFYRSPTQGAPRTRRGSGRPARVDVPTGPRFDESVRAIRAPLRGESVSGRYYEVTGPLEPLPTRSQGLPRGSVAGDRTPSCVGHCGWGTNAWLRHTTPRRNNSETAGSDCSNRVRPADATPADSRTVWRRCGSTSTTVRRTTCTRACLRRLWTRPVEELREQLPFGSADVVANKLNAFREAGVSRVFIWPVADELEQLRRFTTEVNPSAGRPDLKRTRRPSGDPKPTSRRFTAIWPV